MCLIRCDVWIRGTPSSPGIRRGPGHHHGTSWRTAGCHRIRTIEGSVRTDTGGTDTGGTVLPANPGGADGLRSPTTNYRPAAADYRPSNKPVPAPAVRPYGAGSVDTDSDERTGRSQDETCSTSDGWWPLTRTGGHDARPTAIWRGSPQFQDAVSECRNVGNQDGPSCSPSSRGQRPEISRFPGLFRVGSNSVERLDCSTPDSHITGARQLSRQTVEDAVRIQPPEGSSLRLDFATRLGGRNDRVGWPTNFYTTRGSSFWGPWPSSHHQKENAGG